ncbi:MAG: hypothetical protein WBD40_22255 [Tepidisphaeraceae bacterium]
MQTRTGRCALLALALLGGGEAIAQTTTNTTDDRLNRTERRLDELEKRYEAELKARDQKIAELEAELKRKPTTAPSTTTSATSATPATSEQDDEIERTRAAVLEDVQSRSATEGIQRLAQDFNPRVAVITDFVGSVTPKNDRANDAYNRFDVREAELDLRAAVDPRADGVLVLAFERDVENPIFPEEGGEEEGGGPESSANVEEAYIFLHDFGVPNLTAKLGRFHVRFGRQNMLHLHDLPTTDPPLVNQAFLSPEALTDAGLSLSYVIPPKFTGGQYVEAIAEVITGEGSGSESPTLGGDLTVDSPALNTHLLWNTDVTRDLNLELGASWLTGHSSDDNGQDVNLFGADVTLLRTDPTGGFNNSMFQAELMYGDIDGADDTNHSLGAYVLGQQQFHKDFYAGLRLDWTENPNDDSQEAWGVTPYVSWYWSEFLRFRFSYQHRELEDADAEDIFFFQATWVFGAHPPHPYWSMR